MWDASSRSVAAIIVPPTSIANKPLSWRLNKEIAGGGALFDLGSHILDLLAYLLGDFGSVQATLDTLIRERPLAPGSSETGPVDVDDIALLHARTAAGTLGTVEISRMGTGAANDLQFEIFGDQGAIRFSAADPSWLEVYDMRDEGAPLGGMRGFRKLETVQRHEGRGLARLDHAARLRARPRRMPVSVSQGHRRRSPGLALAGRRTAHPGRHGGGRAVVGERRLGECRRSPVGSQWIT